MKTGNKIENIQGLRFFAAMAVVLFHFAPYIGFFGLEAVGEPFGRFGFAGVDVFFVISGFIMWHTSRTSHGGAGALLFAARRIVRVLITFVPMFFAMAAAVYWLDRDLLHDRFLIAESFFLLPIPNKLNLFAISWTLSFEIYFYAAFALFLLAPRRHLAALTMAWSVAIVAANLHDPDLIRTRTLGFDHFLSSPFVLEFAAGALLAFATTDSDGRIRSAGVPWIFLLILAAALMGQFRFFEGRVTDARRIVMYGLSSALFLWAAVEAEKSGRRLPRAICLLGDASYCLYLLHWPALFVYKRTVFQYSKPLPEAAALAILFAYVGAIVAASALIHRCCERPLHNRTSGFLRKKGGRIERSPALLPANR